MLRRLLLLLVGWCIAAIVAVAIAMACALWSPRQAMQLAWPIPATSSIPAAPMLECDDSEAGFGVHSVIVSTVDQRYTEQGILEFWADGRWQSPFDLPGFQARMFQTQHVAAGVPWPALRGHRWSSMPYADANTTKGRGDVGVSQFRPEDSWRLIGSKRLVPIAPAPGLAANATLYLVTALLGRGIYLLHRRCWWQIGGRCVGCGYRAGKADRCPECGRTLAAGGTP